MRIVLRTLVILAVALLVVGATVAIAGQSGTAGNTFERREPAPGALEQGALGQGAEGQARVRPDGRRREGGRDGGRAGGGLFGVVEIGRSVVMMGFVVAPFAVAAGLRQRSRRRLKTKAL